MAGVTDGSDINMFDVPLHALRSKTRLLLSSLLNPLKVIPSEEGLPRDWRGLLQLAGVCGTLPQHCQDPTAQVLTMWEKVNRKEDGPKPSVGELQLFLGKLDRWDVFDDTAEMMRNDAMDFVSQSSKLCPQVQDIEREADKQILTRDDVSRFEMGLPAQTYDAFLLYAEEDENFASQMVQKLENEYGLKLCLKDRDLIGGLTFEHEAILKLIAERCNRVIVIVSPNFLRSSAHSSANKFFVLFAQALGIDQGKRKVVPCVYEPCRLPAELGYFCRLDFYRSGQLFNFWDKLRDSIVAPSSPSLKSITANPTLSKKERCIVREVPETEVQPQLGPVHSKGTTLVALTDPSKTDQWIPIKPAGSRAYTLNTQYGLTGEVSKPKSPANFLRKLLPKELSPSASPLDISKPKKKWFSKKKAVALENS